MSKIKILLIGSAGMAGFLLRTELLKLSNKIELFDIARNSDVIKPKFKLDVTNKNEIYNIILNIDFDYIINCVGILNKNAEMNIANAIYINSYFPHFLDEMTINSSTKIIHLSTDCVFSGKKGNYVEEDHKDGNGIYSLSKSLGELTNPKNLTIRTSIIGPDLNENGIGLFNWAIKNKDNQIEGFSNVFWSGVTTIELTKYIISSILENKVPNGLIHLTNNSKISKYELLCLIKKIFNFKNQRIRQSNLYYSDKSILNTRKELNLQIPTYEKMIENMKNWIIENNFKI